MKDQTVALAVVGVARLAWCGVTTWFEWLQERARGRLLVAVLRTAGAGASAIDRRGDGSVLIVFGSAPAAGPRGGWA